MTGSIKIGIALFAFAFTIVALPAGTGTPGSPALHGAASIRSSVFYGSQGNMCSAIVVDCTDIASRSLALQNGPATDQIRKQFQGGDVYGRRALVHAAAESLAPPGTRGARLPGSTRNIGDCTNESTEEYENVSIHFDDNECRPSSNHVRITWKNQDCASAGSLEKAFSSLAQADLCGYYTSRLVELQKDQARDLKGEAAVLEQLATQAQDLKLRESLLQRASLLKASSSYVAKAAEEFAPK